MNHIDDDNLLTNASYSHNVPNRQFVDDRHKFWTLFISKATFCTQTSCINYTDNKHRLERLAFPLNNSCILFVICKKNSHWVEVMIERNDSCGLALFNSIYPQQYFFESEFNRKLSWDITRPGRLTSIIGIIPYTYGFNCVARWEHICSNLIETFFVFHQAITSRLRMLGIQP